jgi:YebC/PmpR family DNA-binding regulatory protein
MILLGVKMSGHSKWATIKHAKGAADAKRGQLFTKFIKEISIAAKMGGGDPQSNPRLRTAILKARGANMPKDNIERAIKKGTGELGGEVYEELSYEGYGPGGVAILVEVLTDNKNRSAANIRTIFAKTGGNLGTTGSVSYMFNRKGVIDYDSEVVSEDEIMEFALEAGADDIINEDGIISVYTAPENFETVLESLQEKNFESVSAEISMVPDTYTALDTETTRKVLKLIERLEEDDDVQNVYSNIDIPEGFEAE